MDLASLEQAVTHLLTDVGQKENLQKLREQMRDPEPREWDRPWVVNRWTPERVPGIERLWDEVARAVAPLLDDSDWVVQTAALLMLQYAPSPAVAAKVLPLTRHRELQVSLLAVHLLAELGNRAVLPELIALCESPLDPLRQAATAALGKLGGPDERSLLRQLLQRDSALGVRNWAARSLGEAAGAAALPELLACLDAPALHPAVWAGVAAGLDAIGLPAAEPLIERAKSPVALVRARALEALARNADPRVEMVLREGLFAGDPDVEIAAGFALALRRNARGKGKLVELMARGAPAVRLAAAGRLASLGERAGFTELVAAYFDPELGRVAKTQLAMIPDGARPKVLEVLDAVSTPAIIRALCDLAGAYGLMQASPLLIKHLENRNPLIELAAALALVRISGQQTVAPVEKLLGGLRGPLERLALAATTSDLWQPLPMAWGDVLLADPCAALVVLGVQVHLSQPGGAGAARIVRFLEDAWSARGRRAERFPPDQNEPVLSEPGLRDLIRSLEKPLRERLQPGWSIDDAVMCEVAWRDPWSVVCASALAALPGAIEIASAEVLDVMSHYLTADLALLRLRAAQALLVLGGPDASERVAPLADDPDPALRALASHARRS